MNTDFQALCKSLLHCIDTGNTEAEESVLCQIRVALREDGQVPQDCNSSSAAEVMR